MSDIFISYKREDQATARKLADALESEGWTVWWEPKLRAGEHFDDVIEKALNEAKCVIVMWSKMSVNSEYVKAEAREALEQRKLIPIKIENVNLPFRFERVQTLSLLGWDGSKNSSDFQSLVQAIATITRFPDSDAKRKTGEDNRKRIFICYRREDSAGYAQVIYRKLVEHFSNDHVFVDVDTVTPGVDFVDAIEKAVAESDVLIALIGKKWAAVDSAGKSRLDDPNDFVRLEISAALERNIRVIPVLVDGMTMPSQDTLPAPLKPLSRRNTIEISNTRLNFDVDQLVRAVRQIRQAEQRHTEAEAQRKAEAERLRERERQRSQEEARRKANEAKENRAQRTEVALGVGDVFLSYSREDVEYVTKLLDYLRRQGLSVRADDQIDYGDRWWKTIVARIRNCVAVVVVMTPSSEESDWVEKEVFFAHRQKKPIFPLLLKGEPFPFLNNVQHYDVTNGDVPPRTFVATLKRLAARDAV